MGPGFAKTAKRAVYVGYLCSKTHRGKNMFKLYKEERKYVLFILYQ